MSDDSGARYYAPVDSESRLFGGDSVVHTEIGEPHPSYSAAMRAHADRLSRGSSISGTPSYRVLLDLTSIAGPDEEKFARLLMDDPILHAIYKIGFDQGVKLARDLRVDGAS